MNARPYIENIAAFGIAIPVLGILAGGVYWWPALKVASRREERLMPLLIIGLGVTVFGIGLPYGVPLLWLGLLWLVGASLLWLTRRLEGSLGHNLMQFGLVHGLTLVIAIGLTSYGHH